MLENPALPLDVIAFSPLTPLAMVLGKAVVAAVTWLPSLNLTWGGWLPPRQTARLQEREVVTKVPTA